jgi:hypothetical protein
MAQPGRSDDILIDLTQTFADLSMVVSSLRHLRARATHLQAPLADELRRLRALIDEALPHLS